MPFQVYRKKWRYIALLFSLLGVFILAACSGNESATNQNSQTTTTNDPSEPQYGGTLEIIMTTNSRNIGYPPDPSAVSTMYYYMPAIESLGRYNEEGKIEPFLAESWESDYENKKITFHLKEGIKFHDGTDFNAEALKWNIEKWIEYKRGEVMDIASMDVLSEHTLQLNLETWNSGLLEAIAYFIGIISPAAVEANGEEWAMANPVGTGPFILEKWDRDVSVTYVKNENYWQEGKPYLDGVKMLIVTELNTAENIFKSGEGHVLQSLQAGAYERLEQTGQYKFNRNIGVFGGLGSGIGFDSVSPDSPFTDIRVRRAVAHAIDNVTISETVARGEAIPTNQYYTPGQIYYNENVKGYEYNPELAKQLLAEAGYPDGFTTNILVSTTGADAYTAIQSYLKEVGIDLKIQTVDLGQLFATYISGEWDEMISLLWPITPASSYGVYFSEDSLQFNGKIKRYPEIEEALKAINLAATQEERIARIKEIDPLVVDELALYAPMNGLITTLAMHKNVHNLGMLTTNAFDWAPEDVWLGQ